MLTTLQIASLSGIVAAGLVLGFASAERPDSGHSPKVFHERLGEAFQPTVFVGPVTQIPNRAAKSDRLKAAPGSSLLQSAADAGPSASAGSAPALTKTLSLASIR